MGSKMNYILGTVTVVAIIGGTIYAIKKSKDLRNVEEGEISLEEARALVDASRITKPTTVRVPKFTVGPLDVDGVKTSFEVSNMQILNEREEAAWDARRKSEKVTIDEEEEYEEEDEEEENIEEGNELRYDPNSVDARNQFIKMELAEWVPLEDTYSTLQRLFDFPFEPQNDGDDMLRTQIIDYRVQFFGFGSRWAKEVTFADIILHYARAAEFNCGESVKYWAEYFLEFNDLGLTEPNYKIDETIKLLNNHVYFNEERHTFGLFGLTRESMDQSIKIANRNIDRSVTYEIEFNEFLKSCL